VFTFPCFLSFILSTLKYICFLFCVCVCSRLCGLVVRVPGYRSRGPGSIPGSTRFSEK
jgi:hypothetical protein